MPPFFVYILFSKKLNRFYTGSTSLLPEERLNEHLEKLYGNSKFTAKANDWILFHHIKCDSRKQAIAIEKHIKSMKSKKYILNLSSYKEISIKLLEKYKSLT